jgi:hypothetical protein
MGPVIGELLPYAVVVAISPIQLIAVILMLLAPRARSTSTGFLIGWLAGLVAVTAVLVALTNRTSVGDGGDPSTSGGVSLAIGLGLVVLAVRTWRSRPGPDGDGSLPTWMEAIDTFTAIKATGLGFGLAFVNPKNLLMTVAAAVAISGADLTTSQELGAVLAYSALAASSVAVVVVAYLLAADRVRGSLDALKVWLERNNAAVMAAVLLVIAAVLVGKGITALSA